MKDLTNNPSNYKYQSKIEPEISQKQGKQIFSTDMEYDFLILWLRVDIA